MSKAGIYKPLTKNIVIQGYKFKIKTLSFEDLKTLSSISQSNPLEFTKAVTLEFTKAVIEIGVLESAGDINTLPTPIYLELLKQIMEFSGLGQGSSFFNPSMRQQTP